MKSKRNFNAPYRKGRGNSVYAIVHDGDTEKWYFQLMKQEENIRIQTDFIHLNGNLREVYNQIEKLLLSKLYTNVFWIIDFDAIIKEENERSKTSISPLEEFIKIKNDIQKYGKTLLMVVNNPCLEFWYLLHYERTNKYFAKYEPELERQLQKYIPNYEKKEKFYKQARNLYQILKPHQPIGIVNSTLLPSFDGNNPLQASAEIVNVVNFLKGIS